MKRSTKKLTDRITFWVAVTIATIGILASLAPSANSVELLVQAKQNWARVADIPEGTTQDTLAWLRDMWSQTHRGEIVVVKPDGFNWGGMEGPPNFVIINLPGATMEQANKYVLSLVDSSVTDTPGAVETLHRNVKQRRWHFKKVLIDSALAQFAIDGTRLTVTNQQALALIVEYDLVAIKAKIIARLRN